MSRPPVRRWLRAGALALAVAPIASPLFVVALLIGLSSPDPLDLIPKGVLYIYLLGGIPAFLGVAAYLTVTWLRFARMRQWPKWKWACLGAALGALAGWVNFVGHGFLSWYEYSTSFFGSTNWDFAVLVSATCAMHGAIVAALIRWMLMKEPPPPPRPSHLTSKPRASSRTASSSKALNSSVSPGTK